MHSAVSSSQASVALAPKNHRFDIPGLVPSASILVVVATGLKLGATEAFGMP